MQLLESLNGASPLVWALGIGLVVLNVLPFVLGGLAFRKVRRWRLILVPVGLSVLCAVMVIWDIGLFDGAASGEVWLPLNLLFCVYAWKVMKSPAS